MLVNNAAQNTFDALDCPELLSTVARALFMHLSHEVNIVNRLVPDRTTNHQSAATSATITRHFSSTTHDFIGR